MQSTLLCLGLGAILFSVAPPTRSFSQGASVASCQEMNPGHIRAQHQSLQHSHVVLRTSAASYLPGQLITVTVRSSRDFMGFLVQARSANGAWDGSRARAGFMSRPGAGAGLKSTGTGPVPVGGSWVLTPPGTHALRCLSDGDTLTHSDKQLKRNLSFVWRAPDTPMGDIRFYITVVQSYFVYWAGIESAVVRDGSRGLWAGSHTTKADGVSSNSTMQEASRVRGPSQNKSVGSATTQGPTTNTSSSTQMDVNRSAALPHFGIQNFPNKVIGNRDNLQTLGSLHNVTKDNKAGEHRARPVTYAQDPNGFLITSNDRSPASLPSADATEIKTTNSTSTPHSQLPSLQQITPIKYGEIKGKDSNIYLKHSKEHTLNPQTTSAAVPTIHHFPSTRPQRDTTHNPTDLDQISAVKSEAWRSLTKPQANTSKHDVGKQSLAQIPHIRPLLQLQTSSPRMFFKAQPSSSKPFLITSASNSIPVSQASTPKVFSQPQTSLLNVNPSSPTPPSFFHSLTTTPQSLSMDLINQHTTSHYQPVSNSPRPQSGLQSHARETSAAYPQIQTASPQSRSHQQPFSSLPKALPLAITLDQNSFAHKYQSQSHIPSQALGISKQQLFQPQSQTEAKPVVTSKWKQPSVKPTFPGPVRFTLRQVDGHGTDEGRQVKVFQHLESIKGTRPMSATNVPYISLSSQQLSLLSSPSASTYTFPVSSLGHGRATTPRSSLGSTLGSIDPLAGNQPKTAPALLALPAPSPISIPPRSPSAEPSSTSFVPSLASVPSSKFSKDLSSTDLFSQVRSSVSYPSSLTSSRQIKGSAFSSTFSPVIASSSIASLSSPVSSTTFPPSHSFVTSTSNMTSSSSPSDSTPTTPHPGPSPAPRRSLYNPSVSSSSPVLLQRLTVGQRLLIHNHRVSSKPELIYSPPTPRTVVYPNPLPHPNPNFKQDFGNVLKPNTDSKPKHPSIPSKVPDKEGKYPDIVPRHSAWELGMLLGCSAGLGMVLVVGIRYMYRQACSKKTEMTLNDREREYGRGERGLIHVQECGDLVRVRRIRENSFVLLAEYDILASPAD